MKNRKQVGSEIAITIRAFLNGAGGDRDWDDFRSCPLRDRELDDIRRRANLVPLPVGEAERDELQALALEAERVACT